jgi:hypothetical protein
MILRFRTFLSASMAAPRKVSRKLSRHEGHESCWRSKVVGETLQLAEIAELNNHRRTLGCEFEGKLNARC